MKWGVCTITKYGNDDVLYYGNYKVVKMLVADVNAITKVIFIFIFTVPPSLGVEWVQGSSLYYKPGTHPHLTPYQEHILIYSVPTP